MERGKRQAYSTEESYVTHINNALRNDSSLYEDEQRLVYKQSSSSSTVTIILHINIYKELSKMVCLK